MFGVTDLWTYVLGAFLIVLLPGPNSLYVLATAARHGVRAGYRGAAGVFVGDTVLMVLSAAGVASLLRAYPPAFLAVKYAGAAYLAFMGLKMAWGAVRSWRAPASEPVAEVVEETPRPFRRALTVSLLNPKAILFFVSFFIQFVDPGYAHPALSFAVLGAIVQVFSLAYLSTLIFGGVLLAAQFRRRRRLSAVLATGAGVLFLGFSAKLATASL
ncbi:leucine efflux protein [Longispora fulva]|uniref:Leucine efflux protein n=1 Tax=Longispora fulva TaxID=619741 RepID=A0A8J7KKG8_9ACTN|nr:leucine efflux protein LeuE [Longispora fulva]MBG6138094.1 leucine efflux protein [Longispora fulva]GIG60347.1 leucine efflux protein [Longispora fulva]